jgi:hypothetical protein
MALKLQTLLPRVPIFKSKPFVSDITAIGLSLFRDEKLCIHDVDGRKKISLSNPVIEEALIRFVLQAFIIPQFDTLYLAGNTTLERFSSYSIEIRQ